MRSVLLYETLWKTLWLLAIAVPAFGSSQWAVIERTFYEIVGVVVLYFLLPWPYLWARVVRQGGERCR